MWDNNSVICNVGCVGTLNPTLSLAVWRYGGVRVSNKYFSICCSTGLMTCYIENHNEKNITKKKSDMCIMRKVCPMKSYEYGKDYLVPTKIHHKIVLKMKKVTRE